MKLYEIVDIASSECSILFNGSCCFSHGRGIVLINSWECARFFEVQDLITYVPFLLKDNTRCGSCIYLTRMNGKIVLSPKIHGKSFENTEMQNSYCGGSHTHQQVVFRSAMRKY